MSGVSGLSSSASVLHGVAATRGSTPAAGTAGARNASSTAGRDATGQTTSTTVNADGSSTTTVTGAGGFVISVSTTSPTIGPSAASSLAKDAAQQATPPGSRLNLSV